MQCELCQLQLDALVKGPMAGQTGTWTHRQGHDLDIQMKNDWTDGQGGLGLLTDEYKACSTVGPLSSLREGSALQAGVQGGLPHLAAAAVDVGAQPPPPRCHAPPAVRRRHVCSP